MFFILNNFLAKLFCSTTYIRLPLHEQQNCPSNFICKIISECTNEQTIEWNDFDKYFTIFKLIFCSRDFLFFQLQKNRPNRGVLVHVNDVVLKITYSFFNSIFTIVIGRITVTTQNQLYRGVL